MTWDDLIKEASRMTPDQRKEHIVVSFPVPHTGGDLGDNERELGHIRTDRVMSVSY